MLWAVLGVLWFWFWRSAEGGLVNWRTWSEQDWWFRRKVNRRLGFIHPNTICKWQTCLNGWRGNLAHACATEPWSALCCRWWKVVPRQRRGGSVRTALQWRRCHGLRNHVPTRLLHRWWWISHPAFTVLFTDQSLTCCVGFFSDSDDTDDWDFEVFSKPSEVQNELYASNEDEEEEVEDVDGKKVMVRSQNLGEVNTKDLYTPNSS